MTVFFDMSSGGYRKTPHRYVVVYLPKEKAVDVFRDYFGVDPLKTSCKCCGPDFSVYESEESPDEAFFHLTPKKFKEKCPWENWP